MPTNNVTRADAIRAVGVTVRALEIFDAAGEEITPGQRGCLADALDALEAGDYDAAIAAAQGAMTSTCIPKKPDGARMLVALVRRFRGLQRLQ